MRGTFFLRRKRQVDAFRLSLLLGRSRRGDPGLPVQGRLYRSEQPRDPFAHPAISPARGDDISSGGVWLARGISAQVFYPLILALTFLIGSN
jgi:hypothetical protein